MRNASHKIRLKGGNLALALKGLHHQQESHHNEEKRKDYGAAIHPKSTLDDRVFSDRRVWPQTQDKRRVNNGKCPGEAPRPQRAARARGPLDGGLEPGLWCLILKRFLERRLNRLR